MNLYKIEQYVRNGYDTYDSAVVCASSAFDARRIHPSGESWRDRYDWAESPEQVDVEFLGVADPDLKPGVILASFNAG